MHESAFFSQWGKWVAGPRTKWLTVVIWIVLAAVLSALAPSVNHEENNNAAALPNKAASVQAEHKIQQAFPAQSGQPALVVFYDKGGLTTSDLQRVQNAAAQIAKRPTPGQFKVVRYDQMPVRVIRSFASKDGTTLVLPVIYKPHVGTNVLQKSVSALTKRIEAAAGTHVFTSALTASGLHSRITGPVGIAVDAEGLFQNADFALLAATTLLVLILLILLYRSPILAFVPLVCVGFAYGVISPLLGLMAKAGWIVVDAQGISIMTVLLFGAGTDYCLFMVSRYRELLQSEDDKYSAIRGAVGGAAGAIAMSGLTVVVSLLALLFAKSGADHRFAAPFSTAIFIMGLAGITLLPALLAILGRVSFYPFIPRTPALQQAWASKRNRNPRPVRARGRFGTWIGRLVTKRPWQVTAITVVILGLFAVFAGQIKPTYDLLSSFPDNMPSRQGYQLLADHVGKGSLAPVQVAVQSGGQTLAVKRQLAALPFVSSVSAPSTSEKTPDMQMYQVTLKHDPYSLASMNEIPTIRTAAENGLKASGVTASANHVWIAGQTATQYDTKQYSDRDTRTVIPIVIGVIALLLLVYLRSVIAMLYLICTVLLSYFSALGLGWLLLHTVFGVPAISGEIPLYAFVFLVALGEDYNIFMVSRIWQEKRRRPLPEAIQTGVSSTSGVITSAGLILAGTFAVLASLPLQILVQFGIVTAIGVLLDTFIVRPLLVPALTSLLGNWAFWPSRR